MTAALLVLLLSQAADLEALLKQQRYQEAVAQARSPEALLKATIAVKTRAHGSAERGHPRRTTICRRQRLRFDQDPGRRQPPSL